MIGKGRKGGRNSVWEDVELAKQLQTFPEALIGGVEKDVLTVQVSLWYEHWTLSS